VCRHQVDSQRRRPKRAVELADGVELDEVTPRTDAPVVSTAE
jgi:hypothetical protein